jgi:hypothetical protein
MKRTIRLTESELVSLVKRIINEAEPEPQFGTEADIVILRFPEGGTTLSAEEQQNVLRQIDDNIKKSLPTLQKFMNSKFEIPKMFQFFAGTSSTGTPEQNAKVARGRIATMENMIRRAFEKYGVRADRVQQLISMSPESYSPSKLDTNFYDASKLPPKGSERFGTLFVHQLTTRGLDKDKMNQVQKGLRKASGVIQTPIFDTQDEGAIVRNIFTLASKSDVKELNDAISANTRFGSLERYLNSQLYDDPREMGKVVDHLNRIAIRSGLSDDTVRMVGNKVNIGKSLLN